MNFLTSVLIGLGSGVIIFPICLFTYVGIRNTMNRRRIKRLIVQGRFLSPIDPRDFDTKAWKEITLDPNEITQFDSKIFRKKILQDLKENEIIDKAKIYIKNSNKTKEIMMEEMKNKHYSDDLINKIFTQ